MRQPSNVRCYLPRSEAAKLLAFLLEVRRIWPDDDFAIVIRELAEKERPA